MANTHRLSVIVPTHGRVQLFKQTLASIEAQTWDDFELIITDDSVEVDDRAAIETAANGYRDRTQRLTHYHFSNPGLGQAANTNQGLNAASGQILRILHSDDLVRPGCFQWEVDQFRRFPEMQLLFQDCLPFRNPSEIKWNTNPLMRIVEPADYFRQFLSTSTALPSGMLFTRESFRAVGGMREDWSFLCDWELFAKLLLRGVQNFQFAGYATSGNYAWRLHEDSTTSTKWRRHYIEHAELLNEWTELLVDPDGLFVSDVDRANFFSRGENYRNQRLIDDVSRISATEFRASKPWFQSHLDASLRRKIFRRFRRRIFKRKSQSVPDVPSDPTEISSGASDDSRANKFVESWLPDLVITPFHGESEIGACRTSFVVPFDNSLNLFRLRQHVAAAKRIRVNSLNLNRFYQLSLGECVKFVRPGTEIEFCFHDNELMTWFGLKAALNQIAPGRFDLIFQSQNPREGTAKGFSNWTLRYRCKQPDASWHREPMNGLTIGVLTLGDRMEELEKLVRTARENVRGPYEIVLIGPQSIAAFEGANDLRQIQFRERDDMGWITRKKNLICDSALYTDIVVCHDRFEFTPSFFAAFENWGCAYGIAAVRLKLPNGNRALDWGVVQGENHSWCQGGLLHYRNYSRFSYVPGGVTLIRKAFWEKFPWCEDLYWNEHEDVELCRRIQRAGHRIHFFPGEMIATRDRWVDENPMIEFSDQQDL